MGLLQRKQYFKPPPLKRKRNMATTVKTETHASAKAPKVKRAPQPLATRVSDQLTKAVLSKKISKEELSKLLAHVAKLESFVDA